MAKINIEFDGKIYSVDEATLAPLASPLERALINQLAGTGAVIRFNGTNYDVDADKLASARNVLTDHLSTVAGTDNTVTVNGVEYGLSETKLQSATDKMNETFGVIGSEVRGPSQGLGYSLNEDGQSYSVTGLGTCEDTDIVIPDTYEGLTVTSIGEGAFAGRTNLTSVEIPDSVTNIRDYAFESCSSLTSVTIGSGVTSIGTYAFWCCTSLTSVTIPDSVKTIGGSAFHTCSSLTSVTIPDSVKTIGGAAFKNCSSLTSVTIGNSVWNIGKWAFEWCFNLTNIYINKEEGSVSGSPWGAPSATVHWNSTGPNAA